MANPDPTHVEIGALRWPVTIALREQVNDGPAGVSIKENITGTYVTRAKIVPLGTQTFLGVAQTDRPLTHWIWLRWLDWIDERYVVLRATRRPDGTNRMELFRIRRVGEVDGRKRFIRLDVEQERRT